MKTIIKICLVSTLMLTSSYFNETQSQVTAEKTTVITKKSITGKKTKQVNEGNRKYPKIE